MGKLSTIPRSGIRDNAARTISEEERATATLGAAARSSATSGAIVRNAAADRDRRSPIVDDNQRPRSSSVVASRRPCATEESLRNRPIVVLLEIASNATVREIESSQQLTCRSVIGTGVARPRRNTWHADRPEDVAPSGPRFVDGDVARENRAVVDARSRASGERRWHARIAVWLARRAREIHADVDSIQRRTGREDVQLTRDDAPTDVMKARKILHDTRDSITIISTARHNRDESCAPSIADISDEDISLSGVVNKSVVGRADVDDGSPITVFETREATGSGDDSSGVNTECIQSSSTSSNISNSSSVSDPTVGAASSGPATARPIEIGIAAFSYRTRAFTRKTPASIPPSSLVGRAIAQVGAIIDPVDRSLPRRNKASYPKSSVARIDLVLRALLLGLLAMCLLCDAALGAPSSSSIDSDTSIVRRNSLEDEEALAMPRHDLGDDELEIIRQSILQGLGLRRLPDPSKANVSQAEYERAHREYLKQVQLSSQDGQESRKRRSLHVFEAAEHSGNSSKLASDGSWKERDHRHYLYFPVAVPDAEDTTVHHASLRFLLLGDHRTPPRDLEALVYLRTPVSRRLLLRKKIPQMEPKDSRWLELDSTEAAASWLEWDAEENDGLELEFLHDGRPTRREISHAKLNVFVAIDDIGSSGPRRKRSTPEELMPLHKGRRSKCKGDNNKKCCRHELTVMFKDLKGFDFIVYPKGFDAGYCKGRCPPRYNPAHHHALLQSLLWKEDRKRVPKPCCAPSKLDQLMIVYFDENDSTQLKVSYWKNIQVLECACS